MKFLLDMGISPSTASLLLDMGQDAIHVRDRGMQRASDAAILATARIKGRVLLTADLDFGFLMAVTNALLPSIVLFRLSNMRPSSIGHHLQQLLPRHADELEAGAFVVVTDTATRVRRLPIGGRGADAAT